VSVFQISVGDVKRGMLEKNFQDSGSGLSRDTLGQDVRNTSRALMRTGFFEKPRPPRTFLYSRSATAHIEIGGEVVFGRESLLTI
jgi:hypothetical protein